MFEVITTYDPYDVWATPVFGRLKMDYNNGRLVTRPLLAACYLMDFVFPLTTRRILGCPKSLSPHVLALHVLMTGRLMNTAQRQLVLDCFDSMNAFEGGFGWGLPFRWYSKHAVYGEGIPYITHTPYVMEALLHIAEDNAVADRALGMFKDTWGFLESLRVMHTDGERLALSYSSQEEGRIVNNAQSYSAFAYALHAVHGDSSNRGYSVSRCGELVKWLISEQNEDGSWLYYADGKPGNFIDCFHSCFMIKNLRKIVSLVPELEELSGESIGLGLNFIDNNFPDRNKMLCRRFVKKGRRDLYRWDLYDQAEYLGVLVDFGRFEEARLFRDSVRSRFSRKCSWWCRIDCMGRKWGKGFLRWGIMPFHYHSSRLDEAIGRSG